MYYLHNRIESIHSVKNALQQLVPRASRMGRLVATEWVLADVRVHAEFAGIDGEGHICHRNDAAALEGIAGEMAVSVGRHDALVPMGFCFPGAGKSGDLPPRPECAGRHRARATTAQR